MMIMTGTKPAVTRPMTLMPPSSTAAVSTETKIAVTIGSTANVSCSVCATVLAWVMLPMPNEAMTAATAKNRARNLPNPPPIAFSK